MNEQALINNLFALINTMGDIVILWWCAGTSMCIVILKLIIDYDIRKNKDLNIGLAFLVLFFCASLVTCGLYNSYYSLKLCQSIMAITSLELLQKGNLDSVMNGISMQFLFPTSTFVLFFLCFAWVIRQKQNHNGDDHV